LRWHIAETHNPAKIISDSTCITDERAFGFPESAETQETAK